MTTTGTPITSGYAHLIDNSTNQTLATTLTAAAAAARADSQRYEERAAELRSEAEGLEGKEGMREAAEDFTREAADADQVAEERAGMAAAYDARAAEASSAASAAATG